MADLPYLPPYGTPVKSVCTNRTALVKRTVIEGKKENNDGELVDNVVDYYVTTDTVERWWKEEEIKKAKSELQEKVNFEQSKNTADIVNEFNLSIADITTAGA